MALFVESDPIRLRLQVNEKVFLASSSHPVALIGSPCANARLSTRLRYTRFRVAFGQWPFLSAFCHVHMCRVHVWPLGAASKKQQGDAASYVGMYINVKSI